MDETNDPPPVEVETVVLDGGEFHHILVIIPRHHDKIELASRTNPFMFGHLRYERTDETTDDGLTIFRYTPPVGFLEHAHD